MFIMKICFLFSSLGNHKKVYFSKLKVFAGDNLSLTQKTELAFDRVDIIEGKGKVELSLNVT